MQRKNFSLGIRGVVNRFRYLDRLLYQTASPVWTSENISNPSIFYLNIRQLEDLKIATDLFCFIFLEALIQKYFIFLYFWLVYSHEQ